MKRVLIAVGALLLLGGAGAQAQDAVKPCKPSRQASAAPEAGAPPAAQDASGAQTGEQTRQDAASAACDAAPSDTK